MLTVCRLAADGPRVGSEVVQRTPAGSNNGKKHQYTEHRTSERMKHSLTLLHTSDENEGWESSPYLFLADPLTSGTLSSEALRFTMFGDAGMGLLDCGGSVEHSNE